MATVLLVDDDPKIRELLRLYVERDGHRTLDAANGEVAVTTALRGSPERAPVEVRIISGRPAIGPEIGRPCSRISAISCWVKAW